MLRNGFPTPFEKEGKIARTLTPLLFICFKHVCPSSLSLWLFELANARAHTAFSSSSSSLLIKQQKRAHVGSGENELRESEICPRGQSRGGKRRKKRCRFEGVGVVKVTRRRTRIIITAAKTAAVSFQKKTRGWGMKVTSPSRREEGAILVLLRLRRRRFRRRRRGRKEDKKISFTARKRANGSTI